MERERQVAMAGLTYKQALFVEAYLGAARGNASEAARIAGYRATQANSGYVRHHPLVAAAIQARLNEAAMTASEVLARLSEQARGSVEDCLTFPEGASGTPVVDLEKARRDGKLHLIKTLRPGKFGVTVEMHDAQAALVQLGRYHGLFIERHEHDVRKYSDEELIARAAGFVSGDAAAWADSAG